MLNTKLSEHSKELKIYDLFSGGQKELKHIIEEITLFYNMPFLKGPLYTIVHELAINSLKALYKFVFFSYMIKEIGMDHLPYQDWLDLFRSEIETHKAENFSRVCKKNNLFIRILFKYSHENLKIEIINPGLPSSIEKKRLEKTLEQSKKLENLSSLLEKMDLEKDKDREGGSLGLPMVIMTLRNLKIPTEALSYSFNNNETTTRIEFPLNLFQKNEIEIINKKDNTILKSELLALFQKLDYNYIEFDIGGNIKKISENFLNWSELKPEEVEKKIPRKFFQNVFFGPDSVNLKGKFENYRIWIQSSGKKQEDTLFNISGYLKNNTVHTLWQKVIIENGKNKLSEGSISETLQLQKITKRYIPEMVILKSKEVIQNGNSELPNEIEDATIFFADISGFTKFSENKNPMDVLRMLNSTLGVAAKIISRNNGVIDKFMGDAIFALFKDAKNAVQASLEIQKVFKELNEFRELTDELPIHLRIGLHSGKVLMGNVGTDQRMDWTAIGDIVNTASRIEKQCEIDKVLISQDTYEIVKDSIVTLKDIEIKMKGKEKALKVYYVHTLKGLQQDNKKNISL